MMAYVRIPKPSYLLSQWMPRERPDAALYRVLTHLAELYQLGEIQTYHRARRSASLNFVVTTSRGTFVFRRHRLSEADVAYEHQVLDHLQRRGFPAPRMLINQAGQAWSAIDGSLYSLYEFMEGYYPTNFLWWPSARREVSTQCGRALAEYHQAVADLVPSAYKWNGYRPTEHKRWREGDWFRQVLKDIRPLLQKPTATSPIDDFARSRIGAIDKMLRLEPVVEEHTDLSKLVIHGDYSPWNVLFRPGQPPVVLDFNESRLDLKIYDVMLATFWFAWRGNRLDQDRVLALQAGYAETGQLHEADINLADSVFQWIMARSLTERLHKHYLGQRPLIKRPAGMEKQYQMCVFAEQQPQQLVAGLKGIIAR
jgi:Ser/Thr protein kinase RdoA (MazF antagonist)